MAIAAGQRITAALLRRLRPAVYTAVSSGDLNGAVTTTDVPGCSITLTTETAGATWLVKGIFDAHQQGTNTANMLGYCEIDGVVQNKQAVNSDSVTGNRHTIAQEWDGTFAAAGSHTIKLKGTLAASQSFRVGNTRMTVTIQEAV